MKCKYGFIFRSVLGGGLSDYSQKVNPSIQDGRMTLVLPIAWIIPLSTVVFGFSLQYTLNLAVVLISQVRKFYESIKIFQFFVLKICPNCYVWKLCDIYLVHHK